MPLGRLQASLAWLVALILAMQAAAQGPAKGFGLPGATTGRARAAAASESADVVKATLVQAADAAAPGAEVPVAIELAIRPGWHLWVNETQARAVPGTAVFETAVFTTLSMAPTDAPLGLVAVQWPEPHTTKADIGDGPQAYAVYEGSVTIFVRLAMAMGATGDVRATLTLNLQACDESNCLPPSEVTLPVAIRAQPGATVQASGPVFAGMDAAKFVAAGAAAAQAPEASEGAIRFDFFGASFQVDPRGAGLALVLLVAFAGGALLNFTPCVLPVIPLKIMALSAAAGDRRRCLRLGVAMSAGVVAFWVGLGMLVGGISGFTAANQLFQYPAFTIALGLFIAVMAVGMAGFFSVNLPQWVFSIEASHESAGGSFVMGVMTAVLSTPCTAPLMGAAAGWAASSGSLPTVLAVFATIGAGMAAPYLALSAYPDFARRMPRTGPASELVKQVMGMLLLAAAAYEWARRKRQIAASTTR